MFLRDEASKQGGKQANKQERKKEEGFVCVDDCCGCFGRGVWGIIGLKNGFEWEIFEFCLSCLC